MCVTLANSLQKLKIKIKGKPLLCPKVPILVLSSVKIEYSVKCGISYTITNIIVYKIPYLKEYFILTEDVAKIGIFDHNKGSPLIFIFVCEDFLKWHTFVGVKNYF